MTFIMRVEQRHVGVGVELQEYVAWRARSVRRGSSRMNLVPFLAAFFMNVAATGWFTVGFEPITIATSASATSSTWFETAPEPTSSSSAATDEAWQRRVQWSTLLVPKPVRTSFWNR